ncbi:hypothetical protein M9H77_15785 [Catharanthus roseus]|uniref:Uncharacterized protein n=1 Tax=Catharanthus roseus TaxID=4058 RepID=A0ACC0AZN2_CATRO|nr:hypothetical protein M9H77_15785 [Catharanthus roseus]
MNVNGCSDGLAMFWNDYVNVNILSYFFAHVDALCYFHEIFSSCYVNGFYGNPHTNERHHSWTLLKRLGCNGNFTWIYSGGINEILYSWEKEGVNDRNDHQMSIFR